MDEKGKTQSNKTKKRVNRLKRLLGVDLCACSGGHVLKCEGVCRNRHFNPETRKIECGECYNIDTNVVKDDKQRRQKRGRKFDKNKNEQSEGSENQASKQRRRERLERDRSGE